MKMSTVWERDWSLRVNLKTYSVQAILICQDFQVAVTVNCALPVAWEFLRSLAATPQCHNHQELEWLVL